MSEKPKNKKTKDLMFIIIIVGFILLAIFIFIGPLIINSLYMKDSGYKTLWKAKDTFAYFGTCISAIGTIFLGLITLYLNNKIEKNNLNSQEKLRELTEISIKSNLIFPFFEIKNFTGMENTCIRPSAINKQIEANPLVQNIENFCIYDITLMYLNNEKLQAGSSIVVDEKTMNRKVYFLEMKNKSDAIVSSIILTKTYFWNRSGNNHDNYDCIESDKEIYIRKAAKVDKIIRKNESLILALDIILDKENISKENTEYYFKLFLTFEITTLSGFKYKQPISIIFEKNELYDTCYDLVEPIIYNNKNN